MSAWVVDGCMTSEGGGPAFNVRFGVEFDGVRYPYKLRSEDPPGGNTQRVIRPGQRVPPEGAWPILVDSTTMWAGKGDPDPGRIYWARYENSQGKVWETRNPGDRSAKLDIARVRSPRLVEWREQRLREQKRKRGKEWEAQALAELRAGIVRSDEMRHGSVWTMRDGKVIRMENHPDPEQALEAVGLRE